MAMEKAKAGIKTSEFWLSLIGAIIPVLNASLGLAIPIEGILSISGVIIAYVFARTKAKAIK